MITTSNFFKSILLQLNKYVFVLISFFIANTSSIKGNEVLEELPLINKETYNLNTNNNWVLFSPDKTILVHIYQQKSVSDYILTYSVQRKVNGELKTVIDTSSLGIVRSDQSFSTNLSFVSKKSVKQINETYKMFVGRQQFIKNRANELTLVFKNDQNGLLQLNFRAYNDGIAFNYVFPEKSEKLYTIEKELTGFKVPLDGKKWMQPYDAPTKWTPAYEEYYVNGAEIGTVSPNPEGWAFPALFHTNTSWLLITEANLTESFCGTRLEQNADNGIYKIRFPEARDGQGQGAVNPSSTLPWTMPWRTIIIGSSLSDIYSSQLVHNLSEKQINQDFSWVKPGKSSWSWLLDADSPKNFEALKQFVDLSVAMQWEYTLVDANWDLMKGGNIKQLVDYANSKGVGVLMWYNSGGKHNTVEERPRDIIENPVLRAAEFKKLKAWGVRGVKIDFWQSDKQNLIQLYLDVLKDAAKYQIMVNLHGCILPRGWSRTYPNLITSEAVRGEECYTFDKRYPEKAPVQNTILPFTRNVVGPMDYTPVVFSNAKFPHLTTYAHELALTLVFNTGIVHLSDNPKSYSSQPEFVKDFLKSFPVVFDESLYVSGEPGKDVVIASRKGDKWYVAGINGENIPKKLNLKLDFIKWNKITLNLIKDGIDGKTFENKVLIFKKRDLLDVDMLPNGGFVAVFSK